MVFISSDGYIRLSAEELGSLTLLHLITGLDDGELPLVYDCQLTTDLTGYTEWLGADQPAVTVGWDWQMVYANQVVGLQMVDTPRSNLMLIDDRGHDAGPQATAQQLARHIDKLAWQTAALEYLTARYGR